MTGGTTEDNAAHPPLRTHSSGATALWSSCALTGEVPCSRALEDPQKAPGGIVRGY